MSSNLIDIYITNTSGFVKLNCAIPKQEITLVSSRIQFTTPAASLACGFIKFETPFFRGNHISSGHCFEDTTYTTVNNNGLVFLLKNEYATISSNGNQKIQLTRDIREGFPYSISGLDTSGFSNAHFVFEAKF